MWTVCYGSSHFKLQHKTIDFLDTILQRAAEGSDRKMFTNVKKEWNVSYTQIMKNTKKIEKMIKETVRTHKKTNTRFDK